MSIASSLKAPMGTPFAAKAYAAVANKLKGAIYVLQLNRMTQVLQQFPDATLHEMGIERCDIPKYAASLLERA